jgi:hypothetical protein
MMIGKFSILTAAAILVGTLGVQAAPNDHTVYLTFSQSVAIPGATLAPGTYIFEAAEPESSSGVVRVLSRDRQHVFATTFTTPVQRPAGVHDNEVVVMGEAPENEPQQVVSWFEPGSDTGFAFSYEGR